MVVEACSCPDGLGFSHDHVYEQHVSWLCRSCGYSFISKSESCLQCGERKFQGQVTRTRTTDVRPWVDWKAVARELMRG